MTLTSNPMLNQLNQQSGRSLLSPNLNQIKQYINLFKNAGNPQALLQNMIQSNPQVRQVMQFVQQNGGDAKAAFYKLAQEKGVNPDQILNMLKSQ